MENKCNKGNINEGWKRSLKERTSKTRLREVKC